MNQVIAQKTPNANRTAPLWLGALILLVLLLVLTLYTLFHEGGHALVGLLFGGKINAFTANFLNLSAHVGIDGTFTPFQQALICAAGVSFPFLVCMVFLIFSSPKTDPVMGWFKLILSMCTINSLLAWVVIPVLVMFGKTASDDSFNFLNITHLPPLLVTGAALIVYLAGWALFLHSMGGLRAMLKQFRNLSPDLKQPNIQKTIRSLAGLAIITASLTAALTFAFPGQGLQPPADYQKVAEVSLSQGALNNGSIYSFTLEQPANVSIFFGLDQVKGGPIQIRLAGSNGYENVFLNIPDPKADIGKGSVHPKAIPLEKGDYEIRVTFQPSQGQLRVFTKTD